MLILDRILPETISVAMSRKERPLEAVLQRIAEEADAERVTELFARAKTETEMKTGMTIF